MPCHPTSLTTLDFQAKRVEHNWSPTLQTLEGHSGWVRSVVFSRKLASGSGDCTVRVWDVATGQVEHTLEAHSGSVSSFVFSRDGSKPDSCQPETIHHHVESRSFYSVDKSGYWVTQNGLRILNLPIDHWPDCMATKGSNLAIGNTTGRVTIITFYSDVKTLTV
jgi:WD40 repeat protein